MALYKRGTKKKKKYWTRFSINGVLHRKPLGTTSRNDAIALEREMIELASAGHLSNRKPQYSTLFPAIDAYLKDKKIRVAPRTIELEQERFTIIKRHFKDCKLVSITPTAIRLFQQARCASKIANRTVNMDVGTLGRLLAFTGHWKRIKDEVAMLPERPSIIGRALTREETKSLLETAASNSEWLHAYCAAVVAANTSARPIEVKHLRRKDIDLFKREVTFNRSKGDFGLHRRVPLNRDAMNAMLVMFNRADALGFTEPEHYLWFKCQWHRNDPTKPIEKWDTAWRSLRAKAGLPGLRFNDLRHTFITEMAETLVSDAVLQSITGQLSQRMLRHYTHIAMLAKQRAFEELERLREEKDQRAMDSGAEEKVQ